MIGIKLSRAWKTQFVHVWAQYWGKHYKEKVARSNRIRNNKKYNHFCQCLKINWAGQNATYAWINRRVQHRVHLQNEVLLNIEGYMDHKNVLNNTLLSWQNIEWSKRIMLNQLNNGSHNLFHDQCRNHWRMGVVGTVQLPSTRWHSFTWVVGYNQTVALLGIIWFLNRYGFLL